MPIPGKGVKISENKMHPSVPYALQGCKLKGRSDLSDWKNGDQTKNKPDFSGDFCGFTSLSECFMFQAKLFVDLKNIL
jgi:hypothetical protein